MKVTKDMLERVLRDFPGILDVEVSDDGKLATVTSETFADLDEADRQERIWRHLRENLEEDELNSVEFVFTNAPKEQPEAA